ncbi:MAG: hypothetical protein B0D82_02885 [Candidatus Sedimenticola endophacoides]|nr:MAG: hypothetical protein B0D82_02885 [Candidatus Sedimenticola endophacoides]
MGMGSEGSSGDYASGVREGQTTVPQSWTPTHLPFLFSAVMDTHPSFSVMDTQPVMDTHPSSLPISQLLRIRVFDAG